MEENQFANFVSIFLRENAILIVYFNFITILSDFRRTFSASSFLHSSHFVKYNDR